MTTAANTSSRKTWLTLAFGVASSALFLWLAARGVDWSAAREVLERISWGWVAAYVGALVGIQSLRMIRWSLLLHTLGEQRWRATLSIGAVGLAAIFFLPARLGEVVRPVMVARKGRVQLGEAISTVVIERLVDGLLVGVLLLTVGLVSAGQIATADTIRSMGLGVGGIFLALTLGVVVAARWRGSTRLVEWVFGRWEGLTAKLVDLIVRFRKGLFALLTSARTAIAYLGLSVLMWSANGFALLLLAQAFGMDLPVLAVFVVIGVTSVGILVPAAPTSVGTFHYAVIWSLGLYGYGDALLFDFAVIFHLGQIAGNLLVGLGGFALGGRSLGRVPLEGAASAGEVTASSA